MCCASIKTHHIELCAALFQGCDAFVINAAQMRGFNLGASYEFSSSLIITFPFLFLHLFSHCLHAKTRLPPRLLQLHAADSACCPFPLEIESLSSFSREWDQLKIKRSFVFRLL